MNLTEFAEKRAYEKMHRCWLCTNLTTEQIKEIVDGKARGLDNVTITEWLRNTLGYEEVTKHRVRYHLENHV